jgi:hypothetical protein
LGVSPAGRGLAAGLPGRIRGRGPHKSKGVTGKSLSYQHADHASGVHPATVRRSTFTLGRTMVFFHILLAPLAALQVEEGSTFIPHPSSTSPANMNFNFIYVHPRIDNLKHRQTTRIFFKDLAPCIAPTQPTLRRILSRKAGPHSRRDEARQASGTGKASACQGHARLNCYRDGPCHSAIC